MSDLCKKLVVPHQVTLPLPVVFLAFLEFLTVSSLKVDFVALSSYGVAGSDRSEVKLRMDLRYSSSSSSF
jgi:hypothetical protein